MRDRRRLKQLAALKALHSVASNAARLDLTGARRAEEERQKDLDAAGIQTNDALVAWQSRLSKGLSPLSLELFASDLKKHAARRVEASEQLNMARERTSEALRRYSERNAESRKLAAALVKLRRRVNHRLEEQALRVSEERTTLLWTAKP